MKNMCDAPNPLFSRQTCHTRFRRCGRLRPRVHVIGDWVTTSHRISEVHNRKFGNRDIQSC